MMKRFIWMAALLAVGSAAAAQEQVYSLPSTTVTVEVEAQKETFFAGPYAPYAKKYLGIQVRQEDAVQTTVRSVRLVPRVEADMTLRYTVPAKAGGTFLALSAQGLVAFRQREEAEEVVWRFVPEQTPDFSTRGLASPTAVQTQTTYRSVQTDTSFSRVPVQQQVTVEKSLEARAKEAAERILNARRERYNITIGNTDATYSGEALGAALQELDRLENEYLTLFTGYSVQEVQQAVYDVTPVAGTTVKTHRYEAFRLSPTEGLVPPGRFTGEPYHLVFDPVEVPEAAQPAPGKVKASTRFIHYRIPAVCVVRLMAGDDQLLQMRLPVYQLGRDCEYPLK